jgi:CheY-like chemotaxis protein
VFDPFFTTKKPGKGTGLGLTLVRRIVSLHNGQVTIEKTDESGTTFRIEIPESEQSGTDSDTTAVLSERQPATLLLLDDDPKIRDILRFFLADLNYAVSEAASKDEAVRALRKHGADCRVVIMDWKLGEEDPEDVIQSLRRIRKGLIVIVVSGYAPDEAAITELDIFRWFTKPYDKNRLDLEIQKALRRFNEDGTVNG